MLFTFIFVQSSTVFMKLISITLTNIYSVDNLARIFDEGNAMQHTTRARYLTPAETRGSIGALPNHVNLK